MGKQAFHRSCCVIRHWVDVGVGTKAKNEGRCGSVSKARSKVEVCGHRLSFVN